MINDCTASILCGGKSQRMGFDKAFLKAGDETPLLITNAHKLNTLFARVALVTNSAQKLAGFAAEGSFWVVEDSYPAKGPLGGICTVLEKMDTLWAFVMACDMPSPDLALIAEMSGHLEGNQVVLCRQNGHLEPLFAFYHKSATEVFQTQLAENRLRLRAGFSKLTVKEIDCTGSSFANLNTPSDVEEWLGQQKGRGDKPDEP